MKKQSAIENLLREKYQPKYLEIVNESHLHSRPGNETHYNVLIVSDIFEAVPLLKRHQKVYAVLGSIMEQIHALSLHTYTEEEWGKTNKDMFKSPKCRSAVK